MSDQVNNPTFDQPAQLLDDIGLDNFAPDLMNRIMGRYNAFWPGGTAVLGLTKPQMRVLAVLPAFDGILIDELAVFAVVEQSTPSRAIDAPGRVGLVRRESGAADNRATRIFLMLVGRAACGRLRPHMSAFYEHMFADISANDCTAFVATVQNRLGNTCKHDF